MKAIGILAGSGNLPKIIIEEAKKNGYKVAVCGFKGHTDAETFDMADVSTSLAIGQFSKVIKFFHDNDITKVCMAGAISKPKILDFRPDFLAAKVILSLKSKGDDSLLRAIIKLLEKENLFIVSAAELVPSLLSPAGVLTKTQPDEYVTSSLTYALPICSSLGTFDIGQSLVVKENMVIAVECLEGTDTTIIRGGELGAEHGKHSKECILVKMPKKGQDERADLPTIGLKTIELLVQYNYKALIIEAGKTLFFDRDKAIEFADKHKFIIWAPQLQLDENGNKTL